MLNFRAAAGNPTIDSRQAWLLFALLSTLLTMIGLRDATRTLEDTVSQPAQRPNILMIMADDLGYNDISSLNEDGIKTPSIDKLAQNGVLFTRFYADSICAPSRVGLLTGREPERSGFRPGGMGIPEEFTTLPELLRSGGYQTRLVGKWHAGTAHRRSWPDRHGFQQWFGFLDQWRLQVPAEEFGRQARPDYQNPWLQRNSALPQRHEGHLTDILLKESVDFIEQHTDRDQPWFLYHAFLAPHHPIQPAQRFASQFPDTPEGHYRALVSQMDFAVGQLLDALQRTGSLENTLIVFLSDNGGTNRQMDNNFPFKGSKAEVFEGSYRTPLVVHWPEVLDPGLNRQIVHNIDLYPTIVSALGMAVTEPLDGRNHWPQWLSQNAHDDEDSPPVEEDSFRFWEKYNPRFGTMNFSVLSADGRWRLSYDSERNVSLYDLASDPTGYRDVAGDYPEQVEALRNQYRKARYLQAQVAVTEIPGERREVVAYDQMRVSDEYNQTILFELLPREGEPFPEALLTQPDDWVLTIDGDRRLHFKSAVAHLSSPRSLADSCAIVGITTNYKRPAFIGGDQKKTLVKLYLDNVLQDSIELPSVAPRRENWPATLVESSRVGQIRFFNQMAFGDSEALPFQLLNSKADAENRARLSAMFFYPKLDDLSAGLCQEDVK